MSARLRPGLVYAAMTVIGAGAFLYPLWLPAETFPDQAHSTDAPMLAAVVGVLVVAAVALELRQRTMNGATVAIIGVLSAMAAIGRLVELPGNNAVTFFLVVLAGVAFGPRLGLLLGITAMATSAVLTGGLGPWLPFQMLGLGWMGAGAGYVGRATRRLPPRTEVVVLAGFGWIVMCLYGGIMNLWAWPFLRGTGELWWSPGLGALDTMRHYWSYYVATSFAWDAAGALFNALLILLTGTVVLRSLRRFAQRLEPVVQLDAASPAVAVQ